VQRRLATLERDVVSRSRSPPGSASRASSSSRRFAMTASASAQSFAARSGSLTMSQQAARFA